LEIQEAEKVIKKTDITYDDVRDSLIRKYTHQKERLNNGNIESYNDYITDEICGEGAFKNEVDAFLHILSICVALAELKLKDQYFFDELKEMIGKYKDGYFDKYFTDDENKADIDADIAKVEQYIALQ
jgi:hypothetical protein